jgi:hypothetical protein
MKELMTKEEILQAIKDCAAELGRPPSITELVKMTAVHRASLYRKFGGYRHALAACGLEKSGPGYETDLRSLFVDWGGVTRSVGKLPTMAEYEVRSKHSIQPLLRRFGIWADVPAGLREYARKEALEADWADVIEIIARGQKSERNSPRKAVRSLVTPAARVKEDRLTYGTPLTYLPLTYAPTCEGGVIFLFGTMAHDLGFAVSHIQGAFPDCEAMRLVGPEKWQPTFIEFELESKNFLTHGHDVRGADLIVCWKHNWENCPLEVIELRKELERMRERGISEKNFKIS